MQETAHTPLGGKCRDPELSRLPSQPESRGDRGFRFLPAPRAPISPHGSAREAVGRPKMAQPAGTYARHPGPASHRPLVELERWRATPTPSSRGPVKRPRVGSGRSADDPQPQGRDRAQKASTATRSSTCTRCSQPASDEAAAGRLRTSRRHPGVRFLAAGDAAAHRSASTRCSRRPPPSGTRSSRHSSSWSSCVPSRRREQAGETRRKHPEQTCVPVVHRRATVRLHAVLGVYEEPGPPEGRIHLGVRASAASYAATAPARPLPAAAPRRIARRRNLRGGRPRTATSPPRRRPESVKRTARRSETWPSAIGLHLRPPRNHARRSMAPAPDRLPPIALPSRTAPPTAPNGVAGLPGSDGDRRACRRASDDRQESPHGSGVRRPPRTGVRTSAHWPMEDPVDGSLCCCSYRRLVIALDIRTEAWPRSGKASRARLRDSLVRRTRRRSFVA